MLLFVFGSSAHTLRWCYRTCVDRHETLQPVVGNRTVLRVWLQKPEQSCCHGVLQRGWPFFGSWRAQFANFTVVQLCMAAFSFCIINILSPSDLFIWTDKSIKTSEHCVCVCKLSKLLLFYVTCIFSNCSFSFKIYDIMNYMLLCTVMWLMFSHILISLMR